MAAGESGVVALSVEVRSEAGWAAAQKAAVEAAAECRPAARVGTTAVEAKAVVPA
jgi:hypothetical protein